MIKYWCIYSKTKQNLFKEKDMMEIYKKTGQFL